MANETAVVDQVYGFVQNIFSGLFTELIVSLVILFIGIIIGRILGRFSYKVLHEVELNKILKSAKISIKLEEIVSKFLAYFIYFIAVVMALKNIGIATDILNIFAIAVMVVIILSIFLAIKDFVPNALSGITIYRKGFIKTGDKIRVKNMEGRITNISLVETMIETKSKDIISIPNSMLTRNEVVKVRKKKK